MDVFHNRVVGNRAVKPRYKIMLLVLSSDDGGLYSMFRRVWDRYAHLHNDVKCIFVYGNSGSRYTKDPSSLVYLDVPENYYPGMITKTLCAMEDVVDQYDFDILVRTNLSTIWDLNAAVIRLNSLSTTECFAGSIRSCPSDIHAPISFVAGVDMVISRDYVQTLIAHKDQVISWDFVHEDQAISKFFLDRHVTPFPKNRTVHVMEHLNVYFPNQIIAEVAKARRRGYDHYRIKSHRNRMEIDIPTANQIVSIVYNQPELI